MIEMPTLPYDALLAQQNETAAVLSDRMLLAGSAGQLDGRLLEDFLVSMKEMNAIAAKAADAASEAANATAAAVSAADRTAQQALDRTAQIEAEAGTAMAQRLQAAEQENRDLQSRLRQAEGDLKELALLRSQKNEAGAEIERASRTIRALAGEKQDLEAHAAREKQDLEAHVAQQHQHIRQTEQQLDELRKLQAAQAQSEKDAAVQAKQGELERIELMSRHQEAKKYCIELQEQNAAAGAHLQALREELMETERDLEDTLEKETALETQNQHMRRQLMQCSQLVQENQTLKDDQTLLTQELKRMQVETKQLQSHLAEAKKQRGIGGSEKDELSRELNELRDDHTVQLAELRKEEAERERQLQEARRELQALRQQADRAAVEASELRQRNDELEGDNEELERDVMLSDQDLEKAINRLEEHGIVRRLLPHLSLHDSEGLLQSVRKTLSSPYLLRTHTGPEGLS